MSRINLARVTITVLYALSGSAAHFLIKGVDEITKISEIPFLTTGNNRGFRGLLFDEGTEQGICKTAVQDMYRKSIKKKKIVFAAFRIVEEDHRGGEIEYHLNLLECPAEPSPVYLKRWTRKFYEIYFVYKEPLPLGASLLTKAIDSDDSDSSTDLDEGKLRPILEVLKLCDEKPNLPPPEKRQKAKTKPT